VTLSLPDGGRRALLLAVLIALQAGMALHYGGQAEQCPNYECYAADYDAYVGQTDRVGGPVIDTSPVTIALDYAPGEALELELVGFDRSVTEGTQLGVYGTLAPNRTFRVEDSVVHPPTNQRYMYGISALTMLLVAALGLRYWRFDARRATFVRRDR